EWVHVQLHQQKGMISLSPPTICNSAISVICNCSEANVNFHMGNIRRKFGVTSRRVAAIMAVNLGLITL
ncbi:LuxR C-terminal-related transcriptional regulator, partial [Pseudomonas aeruginosa]|uniref:LuxR C-terminal-related transcriptional regulator n=1 Tax=Pseudomonas aeruginosa TaxID=287 RepID=UPI00406C6BCD